MKWFTILYDTIWFRCHPVWQDADGRALYPSWRAAYDTAKVLSS